MMRPVGGRPVLAGLLLFTAGAQAREPPDAATPPAAEPETAPDPLRAAVEEAERRTETEWPLAYVDRPQTLLDGMLSLGLSARDLFGGPEGYAQRSLGASLTKAITSRWDAGLTFPTLYCGGEGAGECGPNLTSVLSLRFAALARPATRLVVGASSTDFGWSADFWTRLELVRAHVASLELEPRVVVGFRDRPIGAWSSPGAYQDGNQSRASFAVDANLQLGPSVVVWADAIPVLPVAQLDHPAELALQVAAGVGFSPSKSVELVASCRAYDVGTRRTWETVPDARQCGLGVVWRWFTALASTEPPPSFR
jgi:hypothetical protein